MATPEHTRSVQELIELSLKTIGALAPGETVDANDLADAFEIFLDMVQELSSDGLFLPLATWTAIGMTANKAAYTIGEYVIGVPDVTMPRPEKVLDAFYRDSGGNDSPVEIIGSAGWARITAKDAANYTAGTPIYLYYYAGSQNATIYLEPRPDSSSSYLYILTEQPITEPATVSLDIVNTMFLPRNYHNPLRYMLAVELTPIFGKQLDPVIASKAGSGYERIIGLNAARRAQPASFEVPGTLPAAHRGTTIHNS